MRFRPLKTLSTTFTVIILILLLPVAAILASWNSIPGSTLYPVKRGLEKTALALLPNSFYEAQLRLKLIDRRTTETVTSLVKAPNNNQALIELLAEARAAQFATTSLEQPQQRSEATQQLITKLTATNQTLEQIKTTPSTTSPNYKTQPTDNNPFILPPYTPPSTQTNQEPDPLPPASQLEEPIPEPTPEPINDTSEQVTQTQEEIEDIIEDLEETLEESLPEAQSASEPEPTDTSPGKSGQSKGKHKGQNKDDHDDNDDNDDND